MIRRFLATLALGFSILIAPISVAAQPLQGKLVRIGVLGNEWWPPVDFCWRFRVAQTRRSAWSRIRGQWLLQIFT
jgi:hypothetical protein